MIPEQLNNDEAFQSSPLIAILRGIKPEEALDVGQILIDEGFRFIEVPLNSPNALITIQSLVDAFGDKAWIGAGTVVTQEQLKGVLNTGARLIVSPNTNPEIIKEAAAAGCVVMPGVMTPTEAFSAISAGASGIKLFPGEMFTPQLLKAFRAVLPASIACIPVGGIEADEAQMKSYVAVGANGFGLGSGLYKPGTTLEELRLKARSYIDAWRATQSK